MPKQPIDVKAEGPVIQSAEPRPATRPGEFVAKAVALVGGTSLVLGGVLGYALGYLDRGRDRDDRRDV